MENYPIYELLNKYKSVSSIVEQYGIPESTINKLIDTGKLDYTLFKEAGKFRRVPHVNIEKLLELVGDTVE